MNELHLFAGAGGGILGGELLGHTCVCAVELEEYPRQVLLQRQRDGILPRFPIWDDVTTFDGKPWRGKVDVVCGGFPCQGFSAAGDGLGWNDPRSKLWLEMSRVIREVQPRYAFVENSPLLIHGIDRVLGDLAEMGYDAAWGIIGADWAGAFHKRNRLWILASHNSEERIQGNRPKKVVAKRRVPWGEDGGGREDIKKRSDLPEPVLLRNRNDVAGYVDRVAAIGNGQVPAVAALAWRLLGGPVG